LQHFPFFVAIKLKKVKDKNQIKAKRRKEFKIFINILLISDPIRGNLSHHQRALAKKERLYQ